MLLTGFGEWSWAAEGYWAGVPGSHMPVSSVTANFVPRVGNVPALGAVYVGERVIPVEFGYTGALSAEVALSTLLTRLQPLNGTMRQLRGVRNDGTVVAIQAILAIPAGQDANDVNTLAIQFIATDPVWTALSDTTVTKTFASTLDTGQAVEISGYSQVAPKIRIQPTAQRATGTTDIGSKLRQRYTITNTSSEPLVRLPVLISLGDTAALVTATKALASGNDLRVWRDGAEVRRTLKAWNTASSGVWVIVPLLKAGDSATYDILYSNPQAGTPPVLAGADLPPIDLTASTNASWVYRTDDVAGNTLLGAWGLAGSPPATVDFDRPGAWKRAMTLANQANRDDVAQVRYTLYTITSVNYYRAVFDAVRARQGGAQPAENHLADGVALHHPLGISSITVGFSYQNQRMLGPTSAMVGKLVVLGRNSGAESWTKVFERSDNQDTAISIVSTVYTPATPVKDIACAVWPNNELAVGKNAKAIRQIAASWNTDMTVAIDTTNLAIAQTTAEEAVYELAATVAMYDDGVMRNRRLIRVGGATGRRLAVKLNQYVLIDAATRRAFLLDTDGITNLGLVSPLAVVATQAIPTTAGGETEIAADDWLALSPYANPLPNPKFGTDASGWAYGTVAAGMTTAALAAVTGRLRAQITANTAAVNAEAEVKASQLLQVNGRQQIAVAADVETSAAGLVYALAVWWEDASAVSLGRSRDVVVVPTANVPYRSIFTARPPAGATAYRVGAVIVARVATTTGSLYLDNVTPNGPEIGYSEPTIGTVDVAALFRSTYP